MPLNATILSAQAQGSDLVLWASHAPHQPIGQRRINIVGTGHAFIPELAGEFIGTVQQGLFVWHLFDQGYCA